MFIYAELNRINLFEKLSSEYNPSFPCENKSLRIGTRSYDICKSNSEYCKEVFIKNGAIKYLINLLKKMSPDLPYNEYKFQAITYVGWLYVGKKMPLKKVCNIVEKFKEKFTDEDFRNDFEWAIYEHPGSG